MYYNTTGETQPELDLFNQVTAEQDQKILALFWSRIELSPSEIFQELHEKGVNYLLTSIRRSLTDLTTAGYLIKTDKKRKGLFGRNECIWRSR